MNFLKLVTLAGITTLLTTGCSFTTESPDRLIKKKPEYNEFNMVLYDKITKTLSESKNLISTSTGLILPKNSKDVGKINQVDFNNDGKDEIISFTKSEDLNENKSAVGFLLLSKEENTKNNLLYKSIGDFWVDGDSIEYAGFEDIDNDGLKEIIMLVHSEDGYTLYTYKYENGVVSKLQQISSSNLSGANTVTDAKLEVNNIDTDKKVDILLFYLDSNNKMSMNIINLENKELVVKDTLTFENVADLSNLYITVGNVFTNSVGVVLDIPLVKSTAKYISQVIYKDKESNTYKKVFEENEFILAKSYYMPVEDINKDGIFDIPIIIKNEKIKDYSNVTWYQWNGKLEKDSNILFINQIYYNYKYNFKVLIPSKLGKNINIDYVYANNPIFKFSYYDLNLNQKELFKLVAYKKNGTEDNSSTVTTGITVLENENYTFVLQIDDKAMLERLNIKIEDLQKGTFELIYK